MVRSELPALRLAAGNLIANEVGAGRVGPLLLGGSGDRRTMFRALSPADHAALNRGEDIVAKGTGGIPNEAIIKRH